LRVDRGPRVADDSMRGAMQAMHRTERGLGLVEIRLWLEAAELAPLMERGDVPADHTERATGRSIVGNHMTSNRSLEDSRALSS
jgi:hypothetical protein